MDDGSVKPAANGVAATLARLETALDALCDPERIAAARGLGAIEADRADLAARLDAAHAEIASLKALLKEGADALGEAIAALGGKA